MSERAAGRAGAGANHRGARRAVAVVAQLVAAAAMVAVYLVVVTSGRVVP
jgi:hypothetical protein